MVMNICNIVWGESLYVYESNLPRVNVEGNEE